MNNELLTLLKKRQEDANKEATMSLVASGVAEALSGDTGGSIAGYGEQLAQSRLKRGEQFEDMGIKLQTAKSGSSKPLTTSNIAKVVGEEGSPKFVRVEEAVGQTPYEKTSDFQLDEKKRLAEFKAGLKSKEVSPKAAADLRKERGGLGITKDTQDVVQAYDRVLSGASGQNAASDVGMVFAFMKMLDPGSVVRESEQMTGRKARGLEEAMGNVQAWFEEGRSLTQPQIKRFVKTAKDIYGRQLSLQKRTDAFYKKEAEKLGIDPESAIGPQFRSSAPSKERPKYMRQGKNVFVLKNGEYQFLKRTK